MTVQLMPHQQKAARELRNGCILKGAVGSGKTLTALSYYADNDPLERLIVITTAKKRDSGDWQAEARLLGLFPEVASWNEMTEYEDVEGAFFIFDEQRVVGSGAWVKSFLKIAKANQWILLSATPGDTWMDYAPVFVANGFYKNRTEFCREHVVFSRFTKFPKVERWICTGRLAEHLRSILVEMPFERHTSRKTIDVFVDHDQELLNTVWKRRWNYLEDRPIRQVGELFALMRRTVYVHPSRIERIRDLLVTHPKMIIFYNFDYELEILRTLREEDSWIYPKPIPDSDRELTGGNSGQITATAGEPGPTLKIQNVLGSFAVAEWNGHNHDPIPDTDSWVYLVQYQAGAEGWNCIETDTTVFYSLTYSYRNFEQAKGRTDRLNTPFETLWYYVLTSSSVVDLMVSRALAEKKNFNERTAMKTWA